MASQYSAQPGLKPTFPTSANKLTKPSSEETDRMTTASPLSSDALNAAKQPQKSFPLPSLKPSTASMSSEKAAITFTAKPNVKPGDMPQHSGEQTFASPGKMGLKPGPPFTPPTKQGPPFQQPTKQGPLFAPTSMQGSQPIAQPVKQGPPFGPPVKQGPSPFASTQGSSQPAKQGPSFGPPTLVQGPPPFAQPVKQGPSFGPPPVQGPSPFAQTLTQGSSSFAQPVKQGPPPFAPTLTQGSSSFAQPVKQGPPPFAPTLTQGSSSFTQPPVQGPPPFAPTLTQGSSSFAQPLKQGPPFGPPPVQGPAAIGAKVGPPSFLAKQNMKLAEGTTKVPDLAGNAQKPSTAFSRPHPKFGQTDKFGMPSSQISESDDALNTETKTSTPGSFYVSASPGAFMLPNPPIFKSGPVPAGSTFAANSEGIPPFPSVQQVPLPGKIIINLPPSDRKPGIHARPAWTPFPLGTERKAPPTGKPPPPLPSSSSPALRMASGPPTEPIAVPQNSKVTVAQPFAPTQASGVMPKKPTGNPAPFMNMTSASGVKFGNPCCHKCKKDNPFHTGGECTKGCRVCKPCMLQSVEQNIVKCPQCNRELKQSEIQAIRMYRQPLPQ